MQTSEPTAHGYVMALPPTVQGSPMGDYFFNLLKGLTHKQNNFLAVISGFSSLILMSADELDRSVKENLEHMKEAAQGAAALAERIMAAAGNARLNLQAVSLKDFIPLVETNLRAPCDKLSVALQVNVDPEAPAILADNGRLRDILVDLMINAAEATASSGKQGGCALDVLAPGKIPESRPGCVDILVRNTGHIPPEKLKDVWQSFKSTKTSKHFGIGLTIAAMLLHQMGGTIGVKSEGDVTTFWVSLPAAG